MPVANTELFLLVINLTDNTSKSHNGVTQTNVHSNVFSASLLGLPDATKVPAVREMIDCIERHLPP